MIKFGKSLREYEKKLIEFERKRTLLYISKLNNQKIWIDIWRGKESKIVSGIVKSIINGKTVKNKNYLLGGEFSFNDGTYYSINDVFTISFKPFSLDDKNIKREYANMFNSSIYGDESASQSNILFLWADLQPQDFSKSTPLDKESKFTSEFRSFNTRYYEIIASVLKG